MALYLIHSQVFLAVILIAVLEDFQKENSGRNKRDISPLRLKN